MDYYDEEKSFPLIGQGIDHWGFFNQTIEPNSLPRISTDKNYRESHEAQDDRYPNIRGSRMGMLKTIVYPTGGKTKLYYEAHDYSSWVAKDLTSNNLPYLKQEWNTEAGGVRIKRITDYASETDSTYREYLYYKHAGGDWEESSGILLHAPRYFRKTNNLKTDYTGGFPPTEKIYSPYGNFLHTEDKTHIGYSEVTERFPDGTYWVYEFSDYKLLPDLKCSDTKKEICKITSSDPAYIDNFYMKYDSRHTQRGKMIAKKSFNKNHKLLYSEEYKYNYDEPLAYLSSAKIALSYFYLSKTFIEDYHVKEVVGTTYTANNGNKITGTKKYIYNKMGQIISAETINSDGISIFDKKQYLSDIAQVSGEQGIYNKMRSKNIVKYPIKTQTSVSGLGITDGKRYNFVESGNGLINLSKTEIVETSTPLSSQDFNFDNYLKTENIYVRDALGNIIQKTDPTGMNTVYIWGKTYLLAEAKNMSLNLVTVIVGLNGIEDKLNITELSSYQIDALYKVKNSEVTVYEYKPLVGISMMIDPYKKRTYYIYNEQGKLVEIRDNNEDAIERYRYHYKNNN